MNPETAVRNPPSRSGTAVVLTLLGETFVGFLFWSALIAGVRMVWNLAGPG